MRGARVIAAVLVAVLLAALGYARAGASARLRTVGTTRRTVIVVGPDGRLTPGLTIASRVRGKCWTSSIVTTRPDAWRCMTSNLIYDPCFSVPSGGGAVACLASPFSTKVTVIVLTVGLPPSDAGSVGSGPPWALRLVRGDQCVMAAGATSVLGGMRANYFCNTGAILFGAPDTSRPTWRIFVKARGSSEHLDPVPIAAAFY